MIERAFDDMNMMSMGFDIVLEAVEVSFGSEFFVRNDNLRTTSYFLLQHYTEERAGLQTKTVPRGVVLLRESLRLGHWHLWCGGRFCAICHTNPVMLSPPY